MELLVIIAIVVAVMVISFFLMKETTEPIKAEPAKEPSPIKEPIKIPEEKKPLPPEEVLEKRADSLDLRRFLRLIKSQTEGKLTLCLHEGDRIVDQTTVVSGSPSKQNFRMASVSKAGSMEPCPEGYYGLGVVEWANGQGSYNASWGEGLGPVWVSVNPHMETERSAIGIHLDANSSYAPGTAGCIGILSIESLKKVVSWFSDPVKRPKLLVVNYGLGSVESKGLGYKSFGQAKIEPTKPEPKPEPKPEAKPSSKTLANLSVGIDVGHGYYGEDDAQSEPGAVGNGAKEVVLNEECALEIKKILEAKGATVQVYAYKGSAPHLTLGKKGNRAALGSKAGGVGEPVDIMISCHHNAFNGSANYSCVVLDNTRSSSEDAELAGFIASSMNKILGFGLSSGGGIVRRSLGVFNGRQTWPAKAACLTEPFFIDAKMFAGKDMNALARKGGQAIAEGIEKYAKENQLV